jgi:esterase/lipase superfamily enzyme
MPTPALFDQPAARAIFQEVPVERRTTFADLLFITDRAPDTGPDAELPYGQERSRSLAFGSTRVALLPQMEWDELKRHSLTDPRDQRIEPQVDSVKELGRYPTEPYPVRATTSGIKRDPATIEQHERTEAALKSEVQKRLRTAPSREVVLYVHGFNETFATAAYTAAELCHFLGRTHVCSFFTWPASSTGGAANLVYQHHRVRAVLDKPPEEGHPDAGTDARRSRLTPAGSQPRCRRVVERGAGALPRGRRRR